MTDDQIRVLRELLGGSPSRLELEGFGIVCSRFVDEFGEHRTRELREVFKTFRPEGKKALKASLVDMARRVGGFTGYCRRYPVLINPSSPAFPLFKIIGIDNLADELYRALDSRGGARLRGFDVRRYVMKYRELPRVPLQRRPVRRDKPRFHWCSYDKFPSPAATQEGLQVFPRWSDCRLRATLPTRPLRRSAFVAFNGDRKDPDFPHLKFVNYFFEPKAQDHEGLTGGGLQIGVQGSPRVSRLEEWNESRNEWEILWESRPSASA